VTRRRGRRRKKLLDDLKDRRGYSHLKEEALVRTMWRNRFGRGVGPVVRQNTEWMNEWILQLDFQFAACRADICWKYLTRCSRFHVLSTASKHRHTTSTRPQRHSSKSTQIDHSPIILLPTLYSLDNDSILKWRNMCYRHSTKPYLTAGCVITQQYSSNDSVLKWRNKCYRHSTKPYLTAGCVNT
jgi:hypothetical protein